ncbi:probable transcription factor At1g61730 [Rosa rugosa]|uniref:probable transcription factor At1g61730 n=1 Tax=Rosa rugosa TaxID=74645 RepID=UPI002B41258C|nr:probable transcription factor At1g61730 [Rosa rugosa]
MAPKRPSPLDEPPAASSSEEEEEASSEEEGSGSGSEESESDAEATEPQKTTSSAQATPEKKPQAKKPESAAAKPQSSSSGETETESESESDGDTLAQRRVNVKPIASKPMEEVTPPPKATKPRSKPSASSPPATAKSGTKRPGGESELVKDSKKAKKKGDDPEEDGVEEESKKSKLFQRLWSDEDEIIILKGMNEYKTKKGVDPYADMTAFHEFIKKSLKVDVTKIQLQDKIRRMRKKFENNVKKKHKPTKAHDSKTFELSKKVWGGGEGGEDITGQVTIASFGKGEQPKSNGKAKGNQKSNSKTLAALKAELLASPETTKEDEKSEALLRPRASDSVLSEVIGFHKGFKELGLSETIVKQGMELIGGSKRADLEDRWNKLHVAELELFVQRTELMRDQGKLILEAFKKSDH